MSSEQGTSHEVEEKTLFGFWLYLLSDVLLFATLFATYAVLRTGTAGGPGPGELVSMPRAFVETVIFLLSSFTSSLLYRARLGSVNFGGAQKGQVLFWLATTFLLGCVVMGFIWTDFAHLVSLGYSWQRSAFLSAYFVLVGTLGLHMAVGLLWMLVLMAQIVQRGVIASTVRRVLCLKMFWCFLNVVWVAIYHWVYA